MPYSGALRIALVAPPLERVPPRAYGGTERIVHELVLELDRRGHNVTLFASGDSEPPANGQLIATVGEALRPTGFGGDASPYFYSTILDVLHRADEFDLIHAHLDWPGILLAHVSPTPVINTFHGRIDFPFAGRLFEDAPRGLVAISRAQAHLCPEVPWEAVVHNGLNLADAPFERRAGEELCFVGRIAPEKGVVDAIEVARLAGRKLRIAAKIGPRPDERAYYENVFMPALKAAGSNVEFLGEVGPHDRDRLFAESAASLMPGSWPEPFGLVAIESLACGTPVIARRAGGLPEILRDGVDGFLADDSQAMAFSVGRLDRLDRQAIRASVLERFSAERMTNDYLAVYRAMLDHMGRGVEPRLAASAARDRWAAASATDGPESEARQPALRTINAPIEAAASRRPD
ncbi:MAG: glycosyltransferase family 4 protein [Chloroflexi bacterium]|nr:MAG: glycosyltransferase family 4 protein [Chloroflexota bacterium]